MFEFLRELFGFRCELAGTCDGYRKDSYTCNVNQRKGDGNIYCGKLRAHLEEDAS